MVLDRSWFPFRHHHGTPLPPGKLARRLQFLAAAALPPGPHLFLRARFCQPPVLGHGPALSRRDFHPQRRLHRVPGRGRDDAPLLCACRPCAFRPPSLCPAGAEPPDRWHPHDPCPGMNQKRIGFIAMSGVRAQNAELLAAGLTLPGFIERSKVIASLPSLSLLTLAG